MGGGKGWRDSGLKASVPPPSPIAGEEFRKRWSGVRFFVGLEVAAEGGVFDLKIVVALLQFLN
jgi:hypothetical protein